MGLTPSLSLPVCQISGWITAADVRGNHEQAYNLGCLNCGSYLFFFSKCLLPSSLSPYLLAVYTLLTQIFACPECLPTCVSVVRHCGIAFLNYNKGNVPAPGFINSECYKAYVGVEGPCYRCFAQPGCKHG